jgi:hypothetical protein
LINRSAADAITVTLIGTLTGSSIPSQAAYLMLSGNQAGDPGTDVNFTATDSSLPPRVVPGPVPGVGLVASAALLGFFLSAKARA